MKKNNFRMKKSLASIAGAVLLMLGAASSQAALIGYETADAGQLPGTSQAFAGSAQLSAIQGSLLKTSATDYADIFRIFLQAGLGFSATTTASATTMNNFDTTLFLFDSGGLGLVANDDDPQVGPTSTIANYMASVTGFYYLAIAGAGYTPLSANGSIFGSLTGLDQAGPSGPGGGLGLIAWNSVSSEGDDYEIVMNGAYSGRPDVNPVPEPGSLALLALGLCAAARIRRRSAASANAGQVLAA